MKRHYRKVPPYMTKTGIQIGLLHQEPFESRLDKDAQRLQKSLLKKKIYKYKEPIHYGDLFVIIVSAIGIIVLITLGANYVI
jgi:hypothetical protein